MYNMHTSVKAVFLINASSTIYEQLLQLAHYHRGYLAPLSISQNGTWVYAYFFYTQIDAEAFKTRCLAQGHHVHTKIEDVSVDSEDWADSFRPIIWQVHGHNA